VKHLPANIAHLAFIRRVWPEAKVIVALRDPRDGVLASLMLAAEPLGSSPADLARAHLAQGELWLTIRGMPGLGWHELRLEDCGENLDEVVARTLDFLGLPWDDAVRCQPVDAAPHSVGRWRSYAGSMGEIRTILAPIVEALGYSEPSR